MTSFRVGFLLLVATAAFAASKVEDSIARDFPKLKLYQKAEGDLNGDGINDQVAILWNGDGVIDDPASDSWNPDALKAILVVYFSNGKDSFQLQATAPKAICVGCGGVKARMGRPLGELSIVKGVLFVTYVGGSRSMWTDIRKWRWSKEDRKFLLIGETYSKEDTLGEYPFETIDINFSTQKANRSLGKKREICRVSSSSKENPLSSFDFMNSGVGDRAKVLKQCTQSLKAQKSSK